MQSFKNKDKDKEQGINHLSESLVHHKTANTFFKYPFLYYSNRIKHNFIQNILFLNLKSQKKIDYPKLAKDPYTKSR